MFTHLFVYFFHSLTHYHIHTLIYPFLHSLTHSPFHLFNSLLFSFSFSHLFDRSSSHPHSPLSLSLSVAFPFSFSLCLSLSLTNHTYLPTHSLFTLTHSLNHLLITYYMTEQYCFSSFINHLSFIGFQFISFFYFSLTSYLLSIGLFFLSRVSLHQWTASVWWHIKWLTDSPAAWLCHLLYIMSEWYYAHLSCLETCKSVSQAISQRIISWILSILSLVLYVFIIFCILLTISPHPVSSSFFICYYSHYFALFIYHKHISSFPLSLLSIHPLISLHLLPSIYPSPPRPP